MENKKILTIDEGYVKERFKEKYERLRRFIA
jgi:hypothetical protein